MGLSFMPRIKGSFGAYIGAGNCPVHSTYNAWGLYQAN